MIWLGCYVVVTLMVYGFLRCVVGDEESSASADAVTACIWPIVLLATIALGFAWVCCQIPNMLHKGENHA